jgi:glutaredoxin 3
LQRRAGTGIQTLVHAVTIYTTDSCPFCVRAKQVLRRHDVPFTEVDVTGDDEKRRWLLERTGRRTVPQIFFGEDGIGGCTDLEALVGRGELDARLGR